MLIFASFFGIFILCSFNKFTVAGPQPLKTVTWRNLEEFQAGGWKPYKESFDFGEGMHFDKPSELDEAFAALDEDSSHGVWTGSVEGNRVGFELTIDLEDPEFCGITQIDLTVRVYFTEETKFMAWPCTQDAGQVCWFHPTGEVTWITEEHSITPTNKRVVLSGGLVEDETWLGKMLIDEVQMRHDGGTCAEATTPEPETTTTQEPETTTTQEPATTTTPEPETTTQEPETSTTQETETTTQQPETSTTQEPETSTTQETETTTQEPETSTTHEPETTTTTTTEDPGDACNQPCEYRKVDCHKYYTCVNFTYKEYHTCPSKLNLAFNPRYGVCDLIDNVPECKYVPPPVCECAYKAHQYDCQSYFYCLSTCDKKTCTMKKCPGALRWTKDFHGDGTGHMQCTTQNNATCATRKPTPRFECDGRPDGSYRNPVDCQSYWACKNGVGTLTKCKGPPYESWYLQGKGCVYSLTPEQQIANCMIE